MVDVAVGLAGAIEALREELTTAAAMGWDKEMRFALQPIELTVQVVVSKDASGKIGWHIIEAGGGYEKVATQTLTLMLSPLWKTEDGSFTSEVNIASPGSEKDKFGPDRA